MKILSTVKSSVLSAVITILSLIGIGTIVYHYLEKWNWVQSFYFSVVTLTTVGYGDLHPTTDASRLFTALFILSGVSVALAALGVVGAHKLEKREKRILGRRERREDN